MTPRRLLTGRRLLLPSEPRIADPAAAEALTQRHLQPALAALKTFFLELRTQLDAALQAAQPRKNGKPYPIGQCLEISLGVERRLDECRPDGLSPKAQQGHQALTAFLRAGGTMRRVWGDLRGQYFQNAFLIGTLYVDVSNDTVVATKPKVEILPFDRSGLSPIADYRHFASIAASYWGCRAYPNHVLPALAPWLPLILVYPDDTIRIGDFGDYLMALNGSEAFRPAEAYLSSAPMPEAAFAQLKTALQDSKNRLPASPAEGRSQALLHVQNYRKKRWYENSKMNERFVAQGYAANRHLVRASAPQPDMLPRPARPPQPMNILFIHQNFPGQFKFLAPVLVQKGHRVVAMTMQKIEAREWKGVKIVPYSATRGTTQGVHPWVSDFETKTIRGEACFRAALQLKAQGFTPDLIIAHPGWGESLFLKDVWPGAKLGIYCEFFYHPQGADTGFDPEFPVTDPGDACRLRLKNLNNLLHFEAAEAGISPTHWQASTFPEPFRGKITVVHDGIDTKAVAPDAKITLTLNGNLTLTKRDEVITFVNRNLEPYRGYHVFMRALPEILKRRPTARILMVGGDDVSYGSRPQNGQKWKDIFANEVRSQIPDADWARVHFLGNIPYRSFIPLLQLSTVHVYLTYPFVLSWSLLEAMSAGCAIVASDTRPLHEAITHGETGRLVPFFDVGRLTDEVCALLDDPAARQRLGRAARAFALKNYDLETVCLPRQLAWVEALGASLSV